MVPSWIFSLGVTWHFSLFNWFSWLLNCLSNLFRRFFWRQKKVQNLIKNVLFNSQICWKAKLKLPLPPPPIPFWIKWQKYENSILVRKMYSIITWDKSKMYERWKKFVRILLSFSFINSGIRPLKRILEKTFDL